MTQPITPRIPSVRLASAQDMKYVIDLSRRHAHALGWIPREAMTNLAERGRLTLSLENGDPCGYTLVSGPNARRLRIFQACVQPDARHLGHALSLVSVLLNQAVRIGQTEITLHCRDGLESNSFWSAVGFDHNGIILGGHVQRRVTHCWRLNIRDALSNPSLPYAASFLAALQRRTEEGGEPAPGRGQTRPAACSQRLAALTPRIGAPLLSLAG